MLYLTKTDFILYLQCPKSLWLQKHKPKVYQQYKKASDFSQKIAQDGYEVEKYVQKLFSGGTLPPNSDAAEVLVLFQATFHTDEGMSIRIDVLERNTDGTYNLYEVKSSTKIKEEHIKDACFQMIALEKSGLSVRDVFIIQVNADYVRSEKVDPHGLLKTVPVTNDVRHLEEKTREEIDNALTLLHLNAIDETHCECYRKTRANHCDAFAYFNGTPEEKSVWELSRITEKKLQILLDQGIKQLKDISNDIELSTKQSAQVCSAVEGRPIVQRECIAKMLNTLTFPLYFFDYETTSNAVPKVVGTKPWQQIPFQFSLHILHENGNLEHKEYLSGVLHGGEGVLRALRDSIGSVGSVISWHASFEKGRNREMGELYPEYRNTLAKINARMFDLEVIFKEAYIDAAFGGSTSLKNVLPVMCPDLSYEGLEVQDGTQAMEQWFVMVDSATTPEKRSKIRNALLKYCWLDTYAMVELYRTLL